MLQQVLTSYFLHLTSYFFQETSLQQILRKDAVTSYFLHPTSYFLQATMLQQILRKEAVLDDALLLSVMMPIRRDILNASEGG